MNNKKEIKILRWLDDEGRNIAGVGQFPVTSFGMAEILNAYFNHEVRGFSDYLGTNCNYCQKKGKWINRNHDPKVESNWKDVIEVYKFYTENEKSIRIS